MAVDILNITIVHGIQSLDSDPNWVYQKLPNTIVSYIKTKTPLYTSLLSYIHFLFH